MRHISFPPKFKMVTKIWKKKFHTLSKVSSTQRAQNLLKVALSLMGRETIDIFNFGKNSRWWPEFIKLKLLIVITAWVYSAQRVQNLLKIAPSLFSR